MADRPPGREAQNGPAAEPGRPAHNPAARLDAEVIHSLAAMTRRRRDAAARMTPLPCGCRDPLPCDLARWCPASGGPPPSRRGLAEALDELDAVGLCACWTGPRPHPQAVAS